MPRLSEFYGIAVYMYWGDHAPPHFHAIYAGEEAQIRIDDGSVLAGSLPRTAANLVREWALLRHDELVANWEQAQAPGSLAPIEGLRCVNDVSELPRIVEVEHLGGLSLRLTFDDGLVRDLDLGPMLHGGVLHALRDTALFATAHVDETARTVAWSNGVDFDPDVLHGDHEPASGAGPRVLAERRLKPAG